MARPITRPVAKWPRKQLVKYAWKGLEYATLNRGDDAAEGDKDMSNFHALTREELIKWAIRGLEAKQLIEDAVSDFDED